MQTTEPQTEALTVGDIRRENRLPETWTVVATASGFVAESPIQGGGKVVRIFNASGQEIGELPVAVATLPEPDEAPDYVSPAAPPEPPRAEYIDAADVAKLVRARLKANFPGVKFRVRTSKYSMGASISVGWTDGPTTKQVDAAVAEYSGSGFDGMIDLKYPFSSWLLPDGSAQVAHSSGTTGSMGVHGPIDTPRPHPDARLVHFGADSVHTSRDWTGNTGATEADFRKRVSRDLCKLQGVEYDGPDTLHVLGRGDRDSLRYHVSRLLSATDFPAGQRYAGVRYAGEQRQDPQVWAEVVLSAKD